jgi:shikimate dehydrogenase
MKPDDRLPLDPAYLSPDMSVFEIIMSPEITPLLQAARATGCRISWEEACWRTKSSGSSIC